MIFRPASLPDALKAAMILSSVAILGMTLMTAAPAFANHRGKGAPPHGQSDQSENPGQGSEKSNGNGGGSGTDNDTSELKPHKPSLVDERVADDSPTASTSDEPLVFFTSVRSDSNLRAKMRSAQKELARLFALSEEEITIEFPDGGYDDALMQAAARARKAERAYRRKHG